MISVWFATAAARVDLTIELVAICPFPVVASEGADIGEGIVVQIEGGEMLVPEVIGEEMDQPLPRSWLGLEVFLSLSIEVADGCLELICLAGVQDLALGILAHPCGLANQIRVFPVEKSLDEVGTCVVNEGLAGGLDQSFEHLAEPVLYKSSHILPVKDHVVFNHTRDHCAEGTLVLEATPSPTLPTVYFPFLPSLPNIKIGIGALLLDAMQSRVDLVILLHPVPHLEQTNQLIKHREAVSPFLPCFGSILLCFQLRIGMGEAEFLLESLGMVQHFD